MTSVIRKTASAPQPASGPTPGFPDPSDETAGAVQSPESAANAQRREEEAAQAADIRRSVTELIPALRGFARSITRNVTLADDLVQETLLRALANIHQFSPGTNLKAWLFAILRNTHISQAKRRNRELNSLASAVEPEDIGAAPAQHWLAATSALRASLEELPEDQREVVILIGGLGLSYEECADICGCPIGTIKSRLNRARARLSILLDADTADEIV